MNTQDFYLILNQLKELYIVEKDISQKFYKLNNNPTGPINEIYSIQKRILNHYQNIFINYGLFTEAK